MGLASIRRFTAPDAQDWKEWAEHLGNEIREWAAQYPEKYNHMLNLARELDIEPSQWRHILSGDSIVTKDDFVYAKLYLRTGLAAADPRHIPPLVKSMPRTKSPVIRPRAWTNDRFQTWLKEQGDNIEKASIFIQQEKASEPAITDQQEPQSLNVDQVIEALRPELRKMLQEALPTLVDDLLAERFSEYSPEQAPISVSELARQLYQELLVSFADSPEKRDELLRDHGVALGQLSAILNILLNPSKDSRERQVTMRRMFNG
jgi:hypothetical protein